MRVYRFLDAKYGLKSLLEKRLKISRLHELNDPFELIPYDLSNQQQRLAVHRTRDYLAQVNGMLCFSGNWRDPVLWAHYSDKHYGLCIEFEVPDDDGEKPFKRVRYVSSRLPFPQFPTEEHTRAMLFTKFSSWQYEEEVRAFLGLQDRDKDGFYYADFGDMLKPTMVIAGARCTLSRNDIINALGSSANKVEVIKARAGFTKFEIVKDLRGFPEAHEKENP